MSANASAKAEVESPFFYAEECGLALFQNRRTGKQFCLDKDTLSEFVASLDAGWRPNGR
ncbi:MAG: hypothetical protein R3D02_13880 [Hyphomicrobiales bacterium]